MIGFFEDYEWKLSGRIKSVLIVFLSAMLLLFYAEMREQAPAPNEAESLRDNPVDSYFLEMEQRISGNMRDRWQQLYLDAWEQELAHAYELMGQDLPELFFEEGGYGMRARQSFGEFMEAQSYLEGYYAGGMSGERGTTADARIELARAQTLRLYRQICEKREGEEMADLYLFAK
ncbi:MAG: hypothetical protein NC417_03725 [Candidatus Gastranaerophilales bacterium]|nr:hypothetical protein [Candidatus Gastranaerophilales bacterium]